ncbi:MAG: hypothetical protein ACI9KE_000183 [Polyangiales bacterium]|jgi:hypothetical protein
MPSLAAQRSVFAVCLGLLLLSMTPNSATATLADALTMDELVQRADRIALIRVVSQATEYDSRGRIVTRVRVRVEEGLLAAAAGDELDVVSLGGIIGDLGMQIAGEPTFEDGERALIFVKHVNGVYRPIGMSQGVFPVSDGDIPRVEPGGSGLSLVRPGNNGQLAPAGAALRGPRSLTHVIERVRALIAER